MELRKGHIVPSFRLTSLSSIMDEITELDIACYLSEAKDIWDFRSRIAGLLRQIGITDFAHTWLIHVNGLLDPFGTYEASWTDEFQRQGFHVADLATRHLMTKKTPIFREHICRWVDQAPFEHDSFPMHREASRLLASFGLMDVYNVPVMNGDVQGLFSITTHNCPHEKFQAIVNKHLAFIHLLAKLVDNIGANKFKSQFHDAHSNPRVPISLRAVELLQTLARKGCTVAEAAAVNGLSEGYANQLLFKARKALGSHSTADLIVDAWNAKLICLER